MEWTWWIALGAISGSLSVAAGAFGAHALKARLSAESLAIFETSARYQMYHALALLAVGFLAIKMDTGLVRTAGFAFAIGTVLFSGSLYALVFTDTKWWGAVTPVGGVAFILGWCTLAAAAIKS